MDTPTLATSVTSAAVAPLQAPGLMRVWASSIPVYFCPRATARFWLRVPLGKALSAAVANLVLAAAWLLVILVCEDAWSGSRLRLGYVGPCVAHPVHGFFELFWTVPRGLYTDMWLQLDRGDKNIAVVGSIMVLLTMLAIAFFVLMPFAARPGSNKACVRHVIRTVLLGTGLIHVWSPVFATAFLCFIWNRCISGLENVIGPLLIIFSVLTLWTFLTLVYAAARDYRRPADLPAPRDPTCDACGYDLVATDPASRCPECGKPVAESLGPGVRPPTAWECRPSLRNVKVICHQLFQLVWRPQTLFYSMPTLTGHAAAHRWLMAALLFVAVPAFWIVPAFYFLELFTIPWSVNLLWGGLAMAIVWALMGLMMAGIETTGIALLSRIKGHPVPLAAAAKVTAYALPLMLPWAVLGGLQILALLYCWDHNLLTHWSYRMQSCAFMASLVVAHVGGLLWYEITVYSGIRSVQYANK